MARRLALEEGLLVGISCGAAAHASRIVSFLAPRPALMLLSHSSSQVVSCCVPVVCMKQLCQCCDAHQCRALPAAVWWPTRCGPAGGAQARKRGQAGGDRAAQLRRALPVHRPVRRHQGGGREHDPLIGRPVHTAGLQCSYALQGCSSHQLSLPSASAAVRDAALGCSPCVLLDEPFGTGCNAQACAPDTTCLSAASQPSGWPCS